MSFICFYILLVFCFYIYMTVKHLWVESSSLYSKVFCSIFWPLTIVTIIISIYFLKQEQEVK